MQTIRFEKTGGPVRVDVRSGWANPGAYELIIWAANSNKKVKQMAGNFLNADDDRYDLPGLAAVQDGRIVEAFVSIAPLSEDGRYFASLLFSQDGRILADVSFGGTTKEHTVTLDLFARLEA